MTHVCAIEHAARRSVGGKPIIRKYVRTFVILADQKILIDTLFIRRVSWIGPQDRNRNYAEWRTKNRSAPVL